MSGGSAGSDTDSSSRVRLVVCSGDGSAGGAFSLFMVSHDVGWVWTNLWTKTIKAMDHNDQADGPLPVSGGPP